MSLFFLNLHTPLPSHRLHFTLTERENEKEIEVETQIERQGEGKAGREIDGSNCNDGNLKTICQMNGLSPSLVIDTDGLYLDEIVIHSIDETIYGVRTLRYHLKKIRIPFGQRQYVILIHLIDLNFENRF